MPPHSFTTPPLTLLRSTLCLQDDVQHIRSAYDAFLAEFPLCYGYWKRYAEAERRHGSSEAAAAVLERGVAATPYSTELWVAYANLLLAADAETDAVRRWALAGMTSNQNKPRMSLYSRACGLLSITCQASSRSRAFFPATILSCS